MAQMIGVERGEAAAKPGRSALTLKRRPELLLSPIVLVLVLLGWEFGVRFFNVPSYLIPPVSDVFRGLWRGLDAGLLSREGYWLHAGITLGEVLLGFAIGSAIGL